MRIIRTLIPFILVLAWLQVNAQQKIHPDSIREKMQWFADAKLGIFIHTGIYAVNGVSESWSFHNRRISHTDYMKQLAGFTLRNYDPAAWAGLIKESGARYAVITTKHHDGVAMYDTRMNALSVVKATPAGRDMIRPFFAECRKQGIKCGAYYSLIDWSHSDYPGFLKDSARYRVEQDSLRWERFRTFFRGQIDEIARELKPELWWFDGDWEHSAGRWGAADIRESILKANPDAIINGRLQGFGDYETPEQNFPVSRPPYHWWELCMTINDSWGYQPKDQHWKTPYEVITIFADVVSNGGNLLLDIGPREDGSIPEEQVAVLKTLGAWNRKHGEAIFNTIPGLPPGHFYGPTTLSKDSTILYLFLAGNPREAVVIKGLFSEIDDVSLLGQNRPLAWKIVGKISWSPVPGLVYIEAPAEGHDQYMSVLRVKLKKPLRLYRGAGGLAL